MENIVEVKNLEKRFFKFALEGINLTVKKGFITGFIGPNGAGKSTTIRCIMNLIRPDQGEIRIFGKTHEADTEEIKQRIGFVQDESFFYGHLSLEQNKKLIAPFYQTWNEELFTYYIDLFELPRMKKVDHLSKGMKMKFSLAMALSHDPELIIMDEPTSGLDPVFRRELLELLQDIIQDEEKAVFFSTHITQDLEKVADFITFIDKGKVMASEEKDALLDQYAVVKGPKEWLTPGRRRLLQGLKETDIGFEGLLADKQQFAGEETGQVLLERPSLEDIMFYTVKERKNDHSIIA
ncbi:ABC transporter ATP-binding protein [Virgibacillus sp. NKC19-16]|uniref:ABC transporter ATP-binding protein n=1 Tax=Virgibacillus salidurans TaxID=2831673 RepID=UPI001F3D0DFC|nr:ABC transporter ATP-binding protein [Virgibacillus sp. NKC19-16]UJL46582.1 ABC transporter ATP-binding protein [Virgibacillus sp. NKC19-16]